VDRQSEGGDQPPTPKQFPDTTPPPYPSADHSWTVQGIYDLKGSVSKLEQAFQDLKESIGKQEKILSGIQKAIWAAGGALVIISLLAGIFGKSIWDTMMEVQEFIRHHPPAAAPSVPPARP
jgi:hypothetical protein